MKRYAWATLWLGLWAVSMGARAGSGQRPLPTVELKQTQPNPMNPATTIAFTLSGELFTVGHRPKVSLKIYNVLAQLVAVPTLQGTGTVLDGQALSCSDPGGCTFNAYWDGKVSRTGQRAAAGVYLYQLVVDGVRYTKKMVVMN